MQVLQTSYHKLPYSGQLGSLDRIHHQNVSSVCLSGWSPSTGPPHVYVHVYVHVYASWGEAGHRFPWLGLVQVSLSFWPQPKFRTLVSGGP